MPADADKPPVLCVTVVLSKHTKICRVYVTSLTNSVGKRDIVK